MSIGEMIKMKKYQIKLKNDEIDHILDGKVTIFLEYCVCNILKNNEYLIINIKEFLLRKLEILILNYNNNCFYLMKRNEKCYLRVIGSLNLHLKGRYFNNTYLFEDCYLKLKIHNLSKYINSNDLIIYRILVKGTGYFKKINSKIKLDNEKSLLIIRSYD